ncbi:hypothetical protein niasHT_015775 [Heterodera trifolii]|uniref:FAM65 N-terminal domain-containing protein n=1 Tax=Heterodera trifolii TaxID=157864 RepID=A0ABD2L5H3_9BILA
MSPIEGGTCGVLGRLQFEVHAIVGFARLCAGDVFEVSVRHGHQRWRSRGKTLADKSQRWEQRTATMDVLWNEPVVVKVLEVKFLKSRCLNERQFDPAKFALAQPQLVTMNLNSAGSIKLRLVVTWLPLLSTKIIGENSLNNCQKGNLTEREKQRTDHRTNGAKQNAKPTQNQKREEEEKGREMQQKNTETKEEDQCENESADGAAVKVCLRDKKRQREQRIQLGNSVSAGSNFGIGKEKWRCSSTTLLDDVYKDLAKSIPTIDDLTVLHPSHFASLPSSSPRHRSFDSESDRAKTEAKNPRRIFSFIKRGQSEASADQQKKDWRKSTSLGEIALAKDECFMATNAEKASPVSTEKNGNGAKRGKPSSVKKGRHGNEGAVACSFSTASSSHASPPLINSQELRVKSTQNEQQNALRTAEALLSRVERIRTTLAQLRSTSEFTELVTFEAAMLNWEAFLKLNRAAVICQIESEANGTAHSFAGPFRRQNSASAASRNELSNNHRTSLYQLQNGTIAGPKSPSTASDGTDESAGNWQQNRSLADQISEIDSGIDSLRQYHSPFHFAATNGPQKHFSDRRKSLGAVVEMAAVPLTDGTTASGNSEVDKCLAIHLDRAQQAIRVICQVQQSPFEYTLSRMLYRMESTETVALEMTLALAQNAAVNCQPSAENVLANLGAEPRVCDCWLSVSRSLATFLMLPSRLLRVQLHKFCEPIVRVRYPKLVENVIDTLMELINEGGAPSDPITVFQFVGLFRGKSFVAFVENISHEAWINSNLASGHPSSIRTVMDRLRGVPVVPPLESLRHIALVLSSEETTQSATSSIEKYFRKASSDLRTDLAACFLCLLEHKETLTRCGACRALALLRCESPFQCLDFLSRSDAQAKVRAEAKRACGQIGRTTKNRRTVSENTKI